MSIKKELTPEIRTLEAYLSNPGGFSVLVLGERGIGKTSAISALAENLGKKVVKANCASFADDTIAESELFGYPKGAFTGAFKDKEGFFKDAENNILFLDEIHTLSKTVQQKLMTALQTLSSEDDNLRGSFQYRRFGETETKLVKFTPIFASNQSILNLKEALLPDFYDRIAQLIVEFPSLEEKKADLYQEFSKVWDKMLFKEPYHPLPKVENFKKWLKILHLYGNYRDLEKIAINWHQQRLIKYDSPETNSYDIQTEQEIFNEVRNNFIKYHQSPSSTSISFNGFNFQKGKSKKKHELEYEKSLLEWSLSEDGFGGNEELAKKGLDSTVRLKTRLKYVIKKLENS